jgi:multisubunit Na+/H+ antiporter MnhC subunit
MTTFTAVVGYRGDEEQDEPAAAVYSNPLPQVLVLTAIVVGLSTTALGLAHTKTLAILS